MIRLLLNGSVDDIVELREFLVTTTHLGLAGSDAQGQPPPVVDGGGTSMVGSWDSNRDGERERRSKWGCVFVLPEVVRCSGSFVGSVIDHPLTRCG